MFANPQEGDDPNDVSDSAELWRRIPPGRSVFDANQGRKRPSSDCFKDHPNGSSMSVYVSSLSGSPESILAGLTGFGIAALSAKTVRELNLEVTLKPKPGEPGHAEVAGKKTDSVRAKLAKASWWIIEPADLS